jgi:hypothetical protein
MELTDAEREEFNELANATYDADLWSKEDLPFYERLSGPQKSSRPGNPQTFLLRD